MARRTPKTRARITKFNLTIKSDPCLRFVSLKSCRCRVDFEETVQPKPAGRKGDQSAEEAGREEREDLGADEKGQLIQGLLKCFSFSGPWISQSQEQKRSSLN